MRRLCIMLLLLLTTSIAVYASAAKVEEALLGDDVSSPNISPDGHHLYAIVKDKNKDKYRFWIDGKMEQSYDVVSTVSFSQDGRHYAYLAARNGKAIFVIDGREEPEYVGLSFNGVVFSADGNHYVYAASLHNEWFLIKDGKKIPLSKENISRIDDIKISPDGEHTAMVAHIEWPSGTKRMAIIRDGKSDPEYDSITGLVMSPNGWHVAYAATKEIQESRQNEPDKMYSKKSQLVVWDGEEGRQYGQIVISDAFYSRMYEQGIVFAPDNHRIAYLAVKNGEMVVVLGKDDEIPVGGEAYNIQFSPNNRHLMFQAVKGQLYSATRIGREFVVFDRKPGLVCMGISDISWSGDGNHLFYTARPEKLPEEYASKLTNREFHELYFPAKDNQILWDTPSYTTPPAFNPDNTQIARVIRKDGKYTVDYLNQEHLQFDMIERLMFSPDGKKLAYLAKNHYPWGMSPYRVGIWTAVVDGKEWSLPDTGYQGTPIFSPDSKHFAVIAKKDKRAYVIMDGQEGPTYDTIYNKTPKFMDDAVEYFASKGGKLYRVRQMGG